MDDPAVDEDVIVGDELLGSTAALEDDHAIEDVERLLERVQMRVDRTAGLEFGDDQLLMHRANRAVDEHPSQMSGAVPGVAACVGGDI